MAGKTKKVDNFKCRAESIDYCNIWLRPCVGWENCELGGYGAPCSRCVASSPLQHERCKNCIHKDWKDANYIE